jgi:SAM-dependent methyltransferase
MQQDLRNVSPWVRQHGTTIAHACQSRPVLDVACGSGRNALFLVELGCEVIGVDKDLSRTATSERFEARRVDLDNDPWQFEEATLGGIIQVHFLRRELFPRFAFSLARGGYLLIETVPGCGGNYLELPKEGELRKELSAEFEIVAYRERRVGPSEMDAVTVRSLARRK